MAQCDDLRLERAAPRDELRQPVAGLDGLAWGRLWRDRRKLDLAPPAPDVETLLSRQGVFRRPGSAV